MLVDLNATMNLPERVILQEFYSFFTRECIFKRWWGEKKRIWIIFPTLPIVVISNCLCRLNRRKKHSMRCGENQKVYKDAFWNATIVLEMETWWSVTQLKEQFRKWSGEKSSILFLPYILVVSHWTVKRSTGIRL